MKNNRSANCRSGGECTEDRAGSECVAHILQHVTDLDPRATIVSVDGVGAFDLVSRNAMFRGLLSIEDGGKVLPLVRMFHGQRSIWEDEVGDVHDIPQGRTGRSFDAPPLQCRPTRRVGRHSGTVAPW